jgi:hypothetical protein
LTDLDQKEAEVSAAWERTPLTVRRALFVTERARLYGAYTERPSNVFKAGEPLLTYVEPAGYAWTPGPNGFTFGVTLDFLIKGKDGKILGGQEKFLNFSQTEPSQGARVDGQRQPGRGGRTTGRVHRRVQASRYRGQQDGDLRAAVPHRQVTAP